MDTYEYSTEKDRCAYWLEVMRSCRLCLFNTLCNLEKNKILDQKNNDNEQNKNTMWGIH